MYTLGNKLNRMYSLHLPFMNTTCDLNIVFNKSNSFIGFNIDQSTYIKSRNGELKQSIFVDLNKSAFATTFLDIRDFKSRTLDIKQQFNNIQEKFRDRIHYETNETVKLSKIKTEKGEFESCLFVYIFRFTDFQDDFLYCLVERQHIDVVFDKKVVRTSGCQLCSNEAYEDLAQLIESCNRSYSESEDIDPALNDVFAERKNIKNRM